MTATPPFASFSLPHLLPPFLSLLYGRLGQGQATILPPTPIPHAAALRVCVPTQPGRTTYPTTFPPHRARARSRTPARFRRACLRTGQHTRRTGLVDVIFTPTTTTLPDARGTLLLLGGRAFSPPTLCLHLLPPPPPRAAFHLCLYRTAWLRVRCSRDCNCCPVCLPTAARSFCLLPFLCAHITTTTCTRYFHHTTIWRRTFVASTYHRPYTPTLPFATIPYQHCWLPYRFAQRQILCSQRLVV